MDYYRRCWNKESDPDIMCITETKLVEDMVLIINGRSKYIIWRKYRKQGRGGGVMMLIKQSLKVYEVRDGKETTEVMVVQVKMKDGKKI